MEPIYVGPNRVPQTRIETEEEARGFILELIEDMQKWRAACDVPIENPTKLAVKNLQRAAWTFLVKQGKVQGALLALLLSGQVGQAFYDEMRQRAELAMVPTVVSAGGRDG